MLMRKWIYTALLLVGFAAFMPGFLISQQGGAIETDAVLFDEDDLPAVVISVDVSMVSVPVTVRGTDGSFYNGLTRKSFRIREDGKEQEITFFAQEGLPVHIAMVLDISGSVRSEWGAIKYSTRRFLENLRPEDNFSITTFNTEIRTIVDWGKKNDIVDAKLSAVYCKDNTKLWDAIQVVSDELFRGIDGKKVIIIMSDGLDNESYYSYSEAVRAAVENGISIYIVSKTKALQQYYEYMMPQVAGANAQWEMYMLNRELAQAESVLRRLAYDTGGRVLQPNSFGQLDDIYADVYEELRNQYTLGYVSTNKARDGSYREIDVRVLARDAPNVRVTARPGYYAPKK